MAVLPLPRGYRRGSAQFLAAMDIYGVDRFEWWNFDLARLIEPKVAEQICQTIDSVSLSLSNALNWQILHNLIFFRLRGKYTS
jgi:hypothetical protein